MSSASVRNLTPQMRRALAPIVEELIKKYGTTIAVAEAFERATKRRWGQSQVSRARRGEPGGASPELARLVCRFAGRLASEIGLADDAYTRIAPALDLRPYELIDWFKKSGAVAAAFMDHPEWTLEDLLAVRAAPSQVRDAILGSETGRMTEADVERVVADSRAIKGARHAYAPEPEELESKLAGQQQAHAEPSTRPTRKKRPRDANG